MTKREPFHYPMPEGVSRALRRLESACIADSIESLRVDFYDGAVHVFVDDKRGNVHYVTHQKNHWFEHREVE